MMNSMNRDAAGGSGGYTFTGNSAGSLLNYFKNGGTMSGLDFSSDHITWWTGLLL